MCMYTVYHENVKTSNRGPGATASIWVNLPKQICLCLLTNQSYACIRMRLESLEYWDNYV